MLRPKFNIRSAVVGSFRKLSFVVSGLIVVAIISLAAIHAYKRYLAPMQAFSFPKEPLSDEEFSKVMLDLSKLDLKDWKGVFPSKILAPPQFRYITRKSMAQLLITPRFVQQTDSKITYAAELALMMGAMDFKTPHEAVLGFSNLQIQSPYWFNSFAGPTAEWSTAGVAYFALWTCLPHTDSRNQPSDGFLEGTEFGMNGTSAWAVNVKNCLDQTTKRKVSTYTSKMQFPDGMSWLENDPYKGDANRFLEDMFVSTLQKNKCTGKGFDNCVYLSLLLEEMAPSNPRTAQILQMIDSEVKADLSIKIPLNAYQNATEEQLKPYQSYLSQLLMRYVFLAAKFSSQIQSAASWPKEAWLESNREQAAIKLKIQKLQHAGVGFSLLRLYEDSFFRPADLKLNQALMGSDEVSKKIRNRLLELSDQDAKQTACISPDSGKHLYGVLTSVVNNRFVFNRLQMGDETQCIVRSADYEYFYKNETEKEQFISAVAGLYLHLDSLIGRQSFGLAHEMALDEYIRANNNHCDDALLNDWASANGDVRACNPWISLPQTVTKDEVYSKLGVTNTNYSSKVVEIEIGKLDPETSEWLVAPTRKSIVDAISVYQPEVRKSFEEELAKIEKYRGLPMVVQLFQLPNQAKSLVILSGSPDLIRGYEPDIRLPMYLSREYRIFLILDKKQAHGLWVPDRFNFQYDSGVVTAISDLDKDGNLEVWLEGMWGECDGEDAEPGVNCGFTTTSMGEEYGNALSWFVLGAKPTKVAEMKH